MKRIVEPKEVTYETLKKYITQLKERYTFLKVATCGKSVMGKELYTLCIGEGARKIIYVGATHAMEWITTVFLLDFCENVLKSYEENGNLSGYNVREIFKEITLVVIPSLNPDGTDIAIGGIAGCENIKEKIYDICKFDFSQWNANANGVDLNHNFNADWYALRNFEEKKGINKPSPRRYGGKYPESEPETKAIVNFLRQVSFDRLYSFHSQGEEIFYHYKESTPEKSLAIAKALAGVSGYNLVLNEGHYSSGGLKDWFIEEFRKPAFTIELGKGVNPLPLKDYPQIYKSAEQLAVLGLIL